MKKIRSFIKLTHDEKGIVFVYTLLLLLVGIILITPLLMFLATGAKTGQVFEKRTGELYAADAGIEDGKWKIDHDQLSSLQNPVPFDGFDFNTWWPYSLSENVNEKPVNVKIKNVLDT